MIELKDAYPYFRPIKADFKGILYEKTDKIPENSAKYQEICAMFLPDVFVDGRQLYRKVK